jgi:hypothetical protein
VFEQELRRPVIFERARDDASIAGYSGVRTVAEVPPIDVRSLGTVGGVIETNPTLKCGPKK